MRRHRASHACVWVSECICLWYFLIITYFVFILTFSHFASFFSPFSAVFFCAYRNCYVVMIFLWICLCTTSRRIQYSRCFLFSSSLPHRFRPDLPYAIGPMIRAESLHRLMAWREWWRRMVSEDRRAEFLRICNFLSKTFFAKDANTQRIVLNLLCKHATGVLWRRIKIERKREHANTRPDALASCNLIWFQKLHELHVFSESENEIAVNTYEWKWISVKRLIDYNWRASERARDKNSITHNECKRKTNGGIFHTILFALFFLCGKFPIHEFPKSHSVDTQAIWQAQTKTTPKKTNARLRNHTVNLHFGSSGRI